MNAEAGEYMFTNFKSAKTGVFAWLRDINGDQIANSTDLGSGVKVQCPNGVGIYMLEVQSGVSFSTPFTVYPMLYDARLNPAGYIPYAMTNRELTERTIKLDEGVVYYEVQGTTDNYGQIDVGLNLNRVTGIFAKDPIGAIAVRATSGNTLQIWAVNNSSSTADTLKQIRNEFVSLMITALPNSEV